MSKSTNHQMSMKTDPKIYVEGKKTEPSYLNLISNLVGKKYEIKPVGMNASSFFGYLLNKSNNEPTKKYKNTTKTMAKPNNSRNQLLTIKMEDLILHGVYLIFDTENTNASIGNSSMYDIAKHPCHERMPILKKLRNKIFFTNPTFEFWLALHFISPTQICNLQNYMCILAKTDKKFQNTGNKTITPKKYKNTNINNACEASKKIYNKVLINKKLKKLKKYKRNIINILTNKKLKKYKRNRISILTETKKAFSEMHLLINELNK